MSRKKHRKEPTNGWDALIAIADRIFALINNGIIIPVFGLFILIIIFLIVYKLPENELSGILMAFINITLKDKVSLYVMLAASNIAWFFIYKRSRSTHIKEIERLSKIRSELLHKTNGGAIKRHRSSDGDVDPSFLLPK